MNASDAAEIAKLASGAHWAFGIDSEGNPREGWDRDSICKALSDSSLLSVPFFEVRRAAFNCWSTADTELPGRLSTNGPWWGRAGVRSPQSRARDTVRDEDLPARDEARRKALDDLARIPKVHQNPQVQEMTG